MHVGILSINMEGRGVIRTVLLFSVAMPVVEVLDTVEYWFGVMTGLALQEQARRAWKAIMRSRQPDDDGSGDRKTEDDT